MSRKKVDLTTQAAICGDMISNIAMAVQQLNPGEEAELVLPIEYKESLDAYKEALQLLNAEVLEVKEEGNKLIIVVKKK